MSPLPRSPSSTDFLSAGSASPTPSSLRKDVDSDTGVNPSNLQRTVTNASITTAPQQQQVSSSSSTPGYRAAEAFVRPAPVAVAGSVTGYFFDLKTCEFNMSLAAGAEAGREAPTVLFLPDYHFPKDGCTVEVTSGKWEISSDEEEGALVQRLRWWHGDGEQRIRVGGLVRRYNGEEGAEEEGGYYDALGRGMGSCAVM